MLVPIGHEHTRVRRLPVVFLTLLAANVAIHLLISPSLERHRTEVHAALTEAVAYYSEHPYLELDAGIESWLRDDFRRWIDEQRQGAERPPSHQVRREQAELDSLSNDALAKLRHDPYRGHAFVPAEPRLSTMITSTFLHGGWGHLLGNMLFLYLLAPFIEDRYGRALFVALYLGGGIAASIVPVAQTIHAEVGQIGASGAIAAVMGAFLVRFATTRVRFLYFMPPLLVGTFSVRAFVVLPLYFGLDLSHAMGNVQDGVAHWAHVGGFAFGVLFAVALVAFDAERRWISPAIEKRLTLEGDPNLLGAIEAREAGDNRRARLLLGRALRENPTDSDAHLELYRVGLALGDDALATRHAARHMALEMKQGRPDVALELFVRVRRELREAVWPPSLLMALARAASRRRDDRTVLEIAELMLRQHPERAETARALAHAATIALRHGDRRAALDRVGRAQQIPGLEPELANELRVRQSELSQASV